jgi:uncharacterized protein YndB with AHSA1/START domain
MSDTADTSAEIAAAPDAVWQMIADVTRMSEWSDENTGAVWTKGSTGPELGARFKGTNRNGRYRWSTQCVVTTSDPGHRFAFRVSSLGLPVATWDYAVAATGTGCTVTETWTDHRPGVVKIIGRAVTGRPHAAEDNLVSMKATLANLKIAAER